MTSVELKEKAKKVKKIENTMKTLTMARKHLMLLSKLDFDSFRLITTTFDDDLYYDIEDKLKLLQNQINMTTV